MPCPHPLRIAQSYALTGNCIFCQIWFGTSKETLFIDSCLTDIHSIVLHIVTNHKFKIHSLENSGKLWTFWYTIKSRRDWYPMVTKSILSKIITVVLIWVTKSNISVKQANWPHIDTLPKIVQFLNFCWSQQKSRELPPIMRPPCFFYHSREPSYQVSLKPKQYRGSDYGRAFFPTPPFPVTRSLKPWPK